MQGIFFNSSHGILIEHPGNFRQEKSELPGNFRGFYKPCIFYTAFKKSNSDVEPLKKFSCSKPLFSVRNVVHNVKTSSMMLRSLHLLQFAC